MSADGLHTIYLSVSSIYKAQTSFLVTGGFWHFLFFIYLWEKKNAALMGIYLIQVALWEGVKAPVYWGTLVLTPIIYCRY